ncbi:MAG: O-antigen ligase family protein [Saprospiraceae bacterium]
MNNSATIKIDLDKTLFVLFCCYAFSLPFELFFEVLFGIETIFKPFRIFSIIIIGIFGIKTITKGIQFDPANRIDFFLYGAYLYGLFISMIRMVEVVFSMGLFFNDLFQLVFFLGNFFIFKTLPFSISRIHTILHYFIAGICLNSLYSFWTVLQGIELGRNAGFSDNPNYFALGILAAIVFFILKFNYPLKFKTKISIGFLLLFLFNMFGVAGSRGALVSLFIAVLLVFIISNFYKKITLIFLATVASLFFLFNNLSSVVSDSSFTLIHRVSKSLSSESSDDSPRFVIWKGVFRTLEDQGYAGLGIGQFKANFVKYYGEESNGIILDMVNRGYYLSPHNDYLYLLTDYGLPSLILYLIFLILQVSRLGRILNRVVQGEKEHFLIRFNFIILIGLIIFGLTTDSLIHPLFWFLLMFITKKNI